jgi:transcriptional regulator with XRE-family HTH domain
MSERDSMTTLTEQLREAIETAGVSRYQISKATGISQPALSKFVLGQRGLSNKAMDAIGEYLGLSICKKRKKSSAKKRRS